MTIKAIPLIWATATLACAASTVSFQTHYISLGAQDTSVAIAADAAGDIFIVSKTVLPGSSAIHVTKTDPHGNVVATFDYGQGLSPAGAAVDAQGNLLIVGQQLVVKLDNGIQKILANVSLPATLNAVTTDASGNVYVAGVAGGGFPTTPGAYQGGDQPSAVVAELSPDLSTMIHATLYVHGVADCYPSGGYPHPVTCPEPNYSQTTATSIAVDPTGSVVIAGYTDGTPAPLGNQPYYYGFAQSFPRTSAR